MTHAITIGWGGMREALQLPAGRGPRRPFPPREQGRPGGEHRGEDSQDGHLQQSGRGSEKVSTDHRPRHVGHHHDRSLIEKFREIMMIGYLVDILIYST